MTKYPEDLSQADWWAILGMVRQYYKRKKVNFEEMPYSFRDSRRRILNYLEPRAYPKKVSNDIT